MENMYIVVSAIQIRFKDVHGVAFTAAIRQKKKLDIAIMMLLTTGVLGPCREHTKYSLALPCT